MWGHIFWISCLSVLYGALGLSNQRGKYRTEQALF